MHASSSISANKLWENLIDIIQQDWKFTNIIGIDIQFPANQLFYMCSSLQENVIIKPGSHRLIISLASLM